jgi:two-component system nitrate/nitrite response regulator NarL
MGVTRPSKPKIRVLVADREGIFRLGLKKLLAMEDDLRVVAEATSAGEVLARAEPFRPDLAFIQEEILAESSSNLVTAIHAMAPRCKVVATTSSSTDQASRHHVCSGAAGVILKTADPQLFVKCARRVHKGETWIPKGQVPTTAKPLEAHHDNQPRPVDTLTTREKTIISCMMQGLHNREISKHLTISEQTVKNHLGNIYNKVGVSDRLELVLYAIHQQLELPTVQATVPLH